VKRCRACGNDLPDEAFAPRRAKCRECKRVEGRAYSKTGPARENRRANQSLQYAKARELLIQTKQRPCMDCGGTFPPYVMHFDHRVPSQKVLTVSALAGAGSIKNMLNEITKCDLVCANCHAIRTHGQREAGSIRGGRPRLSV
jgi:5-methylcytosine-specific restriction endonuclease McrA